MSWEHPELSNYATPTHDLRLWVSCHELLQHRTHRLHGSLSWSLHRTPGQTMRETLGDTVIGKRTSRKLGVGDRKCSEGLTRKWSIGKIQNSWKKKNKHREIWNQSGKSRGHEMFCPGSSRDRKEQTDYIQGKNLARLIMGNLISRLANRNGSPGQCMYELTISSGNKTGQQECQEKNKTNSSSHTPHKTSLYISHTHAWKIQQVQLE